MVEDGIWRLGVIWGNDLKPEIPPTQSDAADSTAADDSKK
jgi:hypothetical protein